MKLCLNDLENIKNTLGEKVHVPAYDKIGRAHV